MKKSDKEGGQDLVATTDFHRTAEQQRQGLKVRGALARSEAARLDNGAKFSHLNIPKRFYET